MSANRRCSSFSNKLFFIAYVPDMRCYLDLLPCRCSMRWHCRTDISQATSQDVIKLGKPFDHIFLLSICTEFFQLATLCVMLELQGLL